MFLIFGSFSANAFEYVRQRPKPNFFVPSADISKNSKYVAPQYGKAAVDAKNNGIHKKIKYRETFVPKEDKPTPQLLKKSKSTGPDYQNKYQEYLKDVDVIKDKGYVRESRELKDDLSKMSSEQRIRIDKKFNANRNVEAKVDNLIN